MALEDALTALMPPGVPGMGYGSFERTVVPGLGAVIHATTRSLDKERRTVSLQADNTTREVMG